MFLCVFLLALCMCGVLDLCWGQFIITEQTFKGRGCNPVKVRVCVCLYVLQLAVWICYIYNGGRPKLTFHRASVISQGMMGTECATFFST